jgi:hypothetical protein
MRNAESEEAGARRNEERGKRARGFCYNGWLGRVRERAESPGGTALALLQAG